MAESENRCRFVFVGGGCNCISQYPPSPEPYQTDNIDWEEEEKRRERKGKYDRERYWKLHDEKQKDEDEKNGISPEQRVEIDAKKAEDRRVVSEQVRRDRRWSEIVCEAKYELRPRVGMATMAKRWIEIILARFGPEACGSSVGVPMCKTTDDTSGLDEINLDEPPDDKEGRGAL